ncbi:hypothetical protein ABW19_dt0210349 [Dactylella cylindrospora]|nr:hypothetical protein ABW19_dt0210349 [Dactylella cylindrospora]
MTQLIGGNFAKWNIPIVIVYTKVDELESVVKDQKKRRNKKLPEAQRIPKQELKVQIREEIKRLQDNQDNHILGIYQEALAKRESSNDPTAADASPKPRESEYRVQRTSIHEDEDYGELIDGLVQQTLELIDSNLKPIFTRVQTASIKFKIEASITELAHLIAAGSTSLPSKDFVEGRKAIAKHVLSLVGLNLNPNVIIEMVTAKGDPEGGGSSQASAWSSIFPTNRGQLLRPQKAAAAENQEKVAINFSHALSVLKFGRSKRFYLCFSAAFIIFVFWAHKRRVEREETSGVAVKTSYDDFVEARMPSDTPKEISEGIENLHNLQIPFGCEIRTEIQKAMSKVVMKWTLNYDEGLEVKNS